MAKVSLIGLKIASLTYSPLLICRGMGDLTKLHYGSHVNDLMNHPMKIVLRWVWKCYNLKKLNSLFATSSRS